MIVVILGLMAGTFLAFLYSVLRNLKDRPRLKLECKRFVNGWRPSLHMIAAAYFIIIALQPVAWLTNQFIEISQHQTEPFARFLIRSTPGVYAVLIIIVFAWIVFKGMKPWLKYSQTEKDILLGEWQNRWGKRPQWVQKLFKPSWVEA